jgi:hypothetical protein
MLKIKNKILVSILLFLVIGSSSTLLAEIEEKYRNETKDNELLRDYTNVYDLQKNTVSNFEFYLTNYGIFGYDVQRGVGGGFWPRGSVNQYIFAGGIWFAVQKFMELDSTRINPDETIDTIKYWGPRKLVSISYNPNNGKSWMVPGRIEDKWPVNDDADALAKYRTYFSTNFNERNGEAIDPDQAGMPNWPIWDSGTESDTLKNNRYFGYYEENDDNRNVDVYDKGPAFISGEDIFTTYKDTDLSRYDGGVEYRTNRGYPLQIQYEEMIYSWGFGKYKDFIFMKYDMINFSPDTLYNCWLAPVMDVDIALGIGNLSSAGARNDLVDYYEEEDTLNLAYQWSNGEYGEAGRGFGYLGFDFLESPAVFRCEEAFDSTGKFGNEYLDTIPYCRMCVESEETVVGGVLKSVCTQRLNRPASETDFVRKDRRVFTNDYQLGLKTFKNWIIENDYNDDEGRYNVMSTGVIDGNDGPGDKRFMMSTGPFHLRPQDTVRTVIGMMIAASASGKDATGTTEDVASLVDLDKFAQKVYDNNFRAPRPPNRNKIAFDKPLNNGVLVKWDDAGEVSLDNEENGLDFMGYRLLRARRTDLDTFSVNNIEGGSEPGYSKGKGPFGWKQIAQWQISTPFHKTTFPSTLEEGSALIDSMEVIGHFQELEGCTDSSKIYIMRVCQGCLTTRMGADSFTEQKLMKYRLEKDSVGHPIKDSTFFPYIVPMILGIDTTNPGNPWRNEFDKLAKNKTGKDAEFPIYYDPYRPDQRGNYLLDSAMLGYIQLNMALLDYNPLFYRRNTIEFLGDTAGFQRHHYLFDRIDTVFDCIGEPVIDDSTGLPLQDTFYIHQIYDIDSYRKENINGKYTTVIDRLDPLPLGEAMTDIAFLDALRDTVYSYLNKGLAITVFPQFEQSHDTREFLSNYFDGITNHRTFIDYGDDDRDGLIKTDRDLAITEKLINNVDYYYAISAYDEGDYLQPTGQKSNSYEQDLPNLTTAVPQSQRASEEISIEITEIDSTKIGGLFNFKLFTVDPQRVRSLLGDKEYEISFVPDWTIYSKMTINRVDGSTGNELNPGLYRRLIYISEAETEENKDMAKDTIYRASTYFEENACGSLLKAFTEDAGGLWTFNNSPTGVVDTLTQDTVKFGIPTNEQKVQRTARISTGNFTQAGWCYQYGWSPDATFALGLTFDYSIQQWGGAYRPNGYEVVEGDPSTLITSLDRKRDGLTSNYFVFTTQKVAEIPYRLVQRPTLNSGGTGFVGEGYEIVNPTNWFTAVEKGFNVGPGEYMVEFVSGGTEEITLMFGDAEERKVHNKTNTFDVEYLDVIVTNLTEYLRPHENPEMDSVVVSYASQMEHLAVEYELTNDAMLNTGLFPNLIYLGADADDYLGKYNMNTSAFVNSRELRTISRKYGHAIPNLPEYEPIKEDILIRTALPMQNRFYLTAVSRDKQDTADFVNTINIGGCQFIFDHANIGYYGNEANAELGDWKDQRFDDYPWGGSNFKPGNKIKLKTAGGALGMPMPGAKVKFRINNNTTKLDDYKDEILNQITISPNPYYLSHQAQASPYDPKLWFNKLPEKCTIKIYTTAGNLINTLEHDALTSSAHDKFSIDIWNLLSTNNTRVESQVLIAVIETPNGAQTVKKFSVVVGNFKVVAD